MAGLPVGRVCRDDPIRPHDGPARAVISCRWAVGYRTDPGGSVFVGGARAWLGRVVLVVDHRGEGAWLGQCRVSAPQVQQSAAGIAPGAARVGVVLTLLASAAGLRAWAAPQRVYSGWQVAAVPASVWVLLVLAVVVCVIPAFELLRRSLGVRASHPAMWVWSTVMVVAVGALVFNALVLAADGAVAVGAAIPIFHWAFTAVTALLAGVGTALAAPGRSGVGVVASVASGVVTLPLFALGWALCTSHPPGLVSVLATPQFTAILGLIPLVVATGIVVGFDAALDSSRRT